MQHAVIKKCGTIQNYLYFTQKPQFSIEERFPRENVFQAKANLWPLFVLSGCHCKFLGVLYKPVIHTSLKILNELEHVGVHVILCWRLHGILNGSQLKQHWWSFHFVLHVGKKTHLFNSSAEMKGTWPTVMPRGCNLFTHLCVEVRNTAGDEVADNIHLLSVCEARLIWAE